MLQKVIGHPLCLRNLRIARNANHISNITLGEPNLEILHKQGIDRKGEQERICLITLHAMSIAQQYHPCKDH